MKVNNETSSWIDVLSGIPQGTVLGPILFVNFNNMPDVVKSMCLLFADDAKLFRDVNLRESSGNTALQTDVNSLVQWSKTWQLPFNTDKCKSLHIGTTNPFYKYKMEETKLDQIEDEKDLGLIIDSRS